MGLESARKALSTGVAWVQDLSLVITTAVAFAGCSATALYLVQLASEFDDAWICAPAAAATFLMIFFSGLKKTERGFNRERWKTAFAWTKAKWLALGAALVALGVVNPVGLDDNLGLLAGTVVLLLLTQVFAFRVGMLPYLVLCAAVGVVAYRVTLDVGSSIAAFFISCALLAVCNYFAQLILDHLPEAARIRERAKSKQLPSRYVIRILAVWSPAIMLVVLGAMIHSHIQDEGKRVVYKEGLVPRLVEPVNSPVEERSIEADLIEQTIQAEKRDKSEFEQALREAGSSSRGGADASQAAIKVYLQSKRPKPFNNSKCSKFRIKRVGSFGSPCRGIINSASDTVKKRYQQTENEINEAVIRRNVQFQNDSIRAEQAILDDGINAIASQYEYQRKGIHFGFLVAEFLKYLGLVALAGAIVAGLQMAIGRVLYDSKGSTGSKNYFQFVSGTPKHLNWTVSRRPQEGNPAELEVVDDFLKLNELVPPKDSTLKWYVALQVDATGEGAKEDLCIPQPASCLLQRFATLKWVLTAVEWEENRDATRYPDVTLSIEGDSHLIAIRLREGQQVGFRVSDLGGFTDGVSLRSIYSTHAGGEILGLGSFHSFAEGDGYLLLISEGMGVGDDSGGSLRPHKLLAWDRKQKFALDQASKIGKMWINTPSLVLSPKANTYLFDQSGARPKFLQRAWRLLRYLFLPF